METMVSGRDAEMCNTCELHRKQMARRISSRNKLWKSLTVALCVLFPLLESVCCYNLDLDTVTIHSGETKSMFGFSVALHQDQGSKWLLVGAPSAQTRQPGVTRGGAVFRCSIDNDGSCQEIPFDTKGNSIRHNGTHYRDVEDKSDQWFGASIYSSSNGIIVACAPRYVYFSNRLDKREPVGTCYVARPSSTDYEEYSPCRSSELWGYHRWGYCQLGYSVAIDSQGRQLLIGAVGSWYWQGQLFNFDFEQGPGRYESTNEGKQDEDYSYMGYSTAVGNFDGDNKEDYVVGVPRGRTLQGKVVLYAQNLTIIDTIFGEQFASYFGYSVAVTDVDGDGLHDVIVGAPLFSDFSTDNTFETGRVYIFYQTSNSNPGRSFTKRNKDVLDGQDSQGRFGLAVAAIGDIDYDNYNDIAVGAPYAGKDGRGVVYIYHGSMKGIITDIQQAIKADEALPGSETFGWSLAGGLDMDQNQYPDLLVGAYGSNKAAFLRSRPVVRVTPTISIQPQNITLSPEFETCVVGTGTQQTKVQCITVYACLLYDGVGVPDRLDFTLNIKFDSLKNDTSRVYFIHSTGLREESKTLSAYKGKQECFTYFAYLVKNIRDKLTPIVVDYSFDVIKKVSRSRREVQPILNQRIPTTVRAEASIMKNCGPDNVCIPDLRISATQTLDYYTLGEEKEVEILVFIENRGEDAFEAMLNITFPEGVTFNKIKDKKFEIPVFCDVSSDKSFVVCDLGNPLPSRSRTNFTLVATPKGINGSTPEMVFRMELNSSNAENISTTKNNVAEVRIQLQQAADLRIGGTPNPEQFVYSDSDVRQYRDSGLSGPLIEHRYVLSNQGPSSVKTALIKVDWPGQDENGLTYLFLEQFPIASRPDISCILLNETKHTYTETNGDNSPVIINRRNNRSIAVDYSQVRRHSREATGGSLAGEDIGEKNQEKRDIQERSTKELKRIECEAGKLGCTHIHCTIGEIQPFKSVNITVRGRIWTRTLVHKRLDQPFYFVSKAKAEVLAMPYNMKIATSTLSMSVTEVTTYVNPERLHPKRKGVEWWIIGVSIAAGILVLLLLIVLLWWCGFFRRRRPEEKAYLVPAEQNGEYNRVRQGPPDAKYKYT
ncbi:integrin alpha-8-like isoform X2 [Dreissena polymorpha]|nr:integrin alpha-8-like isoform X2 [Dreissena polymorpha]